MVQSLPRSLPRRLVTLCTDPALRGGWRALLAVLLVAITTLALVPAPPPSLSTGWDKSNHLLAFGTLAFASAWGVWPRPRQWGWLVLALIGIGIGIEIAQSFFPPREADWHDVVADTVGIAVGLLAAWPVAAAASRGAVTTTFEPSGAAAVLTGTSPAVSPHAEVAPPPQDP